MKPAKPQILKINGGSPSIKCAVFEADGSLRRILEGGIERIGLSNASLWVKGMNASDTFSRTVPAANLAMAASAMVESLTQRGASQALTAVGHRVLQGNAKDYTPQHITLDLIAELRLVSPFDPDHIPDLVIAQLVC
ncbi:MAG: hypothetical protein ABI142_03660 [Bryocella sp.]